MTPSSTASVTLKHAIKQFLRRLAQSGAVATGLPESTWNLHRVPSAGPDQPLRLHDTDLHSLLGEHGSPLHVVDLNTLTAQVRSLSDTGVELFYSYKTNPVPGSLAAMHAAGASAEIISGYEWWLARRLGIPAERIIYNGPAKDDESLRAAVAEGCLSINLNSLNELERIEAIARDCGRPARVGLRVCLAGGWSGQFGLQGDQLAAVVARLRGNAHLLPVSLHSHRGISIRSPETADTHFDGALDAWRRLSEELGTRLEILNVGGSLGCPTVDWISPWHQRLARTLLRPPAPPVPEQCIRPRDYALRLADRARAFCREHQLEVPRLVIEPGRAITSSSQLLLTTVLDCKPGDGDYDYLILDAGINLAESMRGEFHQIFHTTRRGPGERTYRLVGPICTPSDVLQYAVSLPRTQPGDVLAIMDTGAYFVPFSTSFSFPQPGICGLDEGGQVTQLRRAERYSDITDRDAFEAHKA